MKAKYYVGIVLGILVVFGITYSSKLRTDSALESLQKQLEATNEKMDSMYTQLQGLNVKVYNLLGKPDLEDRVIQFEAENEKLKESVNRLIVPSCYEEQCFPVYIGDVDTYKPVVKDIIELKDTGTVEERIQTLADSLSETFFSGKPIELMKIEEQNGKQIALMNLKNKEGEEHSWERSAFQGTAGGTCTQISLIETFLQREYEGEWIDGVQFLNEGEPIEEQHVEGLWGTVYR